MITSNKLISLIKKNSLPFSSDYGAGFNVRKEYKGAEVEISYSCGRNWNEEKRIENFVKLGNILLIEKIDFGFNVDSYGIKFLFNSNCQSTIYSEEFFRNCTADILKEYKEQTEKENNIKREKEIARENRHNTLKEIAKNLNPDLKYEILEKIDENHVIGYCRLNTQKTPVFMQFSGECREDWRDGKFRWNLKLQPTQWNNGSFDGGSTIMNSCDTIEDGLIEYLITWCIYLPE